MELRGGAAAAADKEKGEGRCSDWDGRRERGDLEPIHVEIQPQDLSTPIVSSVSQGNGEYLSRIDVETPAKSFYMVLNTNNDVNWL
ncbi:hypothetical protein FF1_028989 [Malus domestica]